MKSKSVKTIFSFITVLETLWVNFIFRKIKIQELREIENVNLIWLKMLSKTNVKIWITTMWIVKILMKSKEKNEFMTFEWL